MRPRLWLFVGIVLAVMAWLGGSAAYFAAVSQPAARLEAGPIQLAPLVADLPPSPLPRREEEHGVETSSGNAAVFYMRALNMYNARRRPFLLKRGLNPFMQEPPIDPPELDLMFTGARLRECDFYLEPEGRPALTFVTVPEGKPWPMRVAVDPFEARLYVGPMRSLAQAALNRGKEWERQGKREEAAAAYQIAARVGWHLRARPGALADIELGLEIELKALHYLESYFELAPQRAALDQAVQYRKSVERLQRAVRRKYAQLDSIEAARTILAGDAERVWRIEAAAALVEAQHYRRLGWIESWLARRSLGNALRDPDRSVRQAVYRLQQMNDAEFRDPSREIAEQRE